VLGFLSVLNFSMNCFHRLKVKIDPLSVIMSFGSPFNPNTSLIRSFAN